MHRLESCIIFPVGLTKERNDYRIFSRKCVAHTLEYDVPDIMILSQVFLDSMNEEDILRGMLRKSDKEVVLVRAGSHCIIGISDNGKISSHIPPSKGLHILQGTRPALTASRFVE